MEKGLLNFIEDQSVFGFTGKINVLLVKNKQYLGCIYLKEGQIVQADYKGQRGQRALLSAIFEDLDTREAFKFVPEPEILPNGIEAFHLDLERLKGEAQKGYQKHLECKRLRPPATLKLLINTDFIINGEEVSAEEFSLLVLMTEFSRVGDIYKHSPKYEYEVTHALVQLRKKGALKVLKEA